MRGWIVHSQQNMSYQASVEHPSACNAIQPNSNFWYEFNVHCTILLKYFIFTLAFTFAHNHNFKILSSFKCNNSITEKKIVSWLCVTFTSMQHNGNLHLRLSVRCALDKIYPIFGDENSKRHTFEWLRMKAWLKFVVHQNETSKKYPTKVKRNRFNGHNVQTLI